MATYSRPGVYVNETLNPVPPSAGAGATAVPVFIGAINQGPTLPGTLITSWKQFTNLYGNWTYDSTDILRYAVRSFLVDGNGGQCYVNRVLGTGASTASRSFYDSSGANNTAGATYTLQIVASNPGYWGNSVYVDITRASQTATLFNITVYYGNSVERFVDLSMDNTNNRYALKLVNGISQFISLVDLSDPATGVADVPATVTGAYLGGGTDATGGQTNAAVAVSVNSCDALQESLIINAPGVTASTDVNILISYAESRGDCFVVVDSGALTVADQLTLAATYTASSRAAVYYPNIIISDPTTTAPGATRVINNGGAVVAQYVATDRTRDVFKAPAGLLTRLGGAVSVGNLSNGDLDNLNTAVAPVNAIRYISGSGIVIMGARTLKQGYVDRYIPVRRTLTYLEKTLQSLTRYAIFEPNDGRLQRQLTATCENFLNSFWRKGGLRGATASAAYYVVCNATNNTLQSIDAGEVHIEIGVSLQRPAEFVVINISQYDGGVTVTTA
jgi:phage tail sheath protein FI